MVIAGKRRDGRAVAQRELIRTACAVLLLSSTSLPAQAAAAQSARPAQQATDGRLAKAMDLAAARVLHERKTAGFVVGVSREGRAPFIRGYGYSDLEDGARVTDRTVFRIGSITKEFTAACILLLAERGRLSLDDKLSKYVPTFPRGGEVTIRQLLNHTSGIRDYTSVPGFLKDTSTREMSEDEMTALIVRPDPLYDFAPGTGWAYSNSGYYLLGIVIEKASGQPYAQFLKANVLDPLALRDTKADDLAEIVPSRADGYDRAPTAPTGFTNAAFISLSVAAAAGAVRSTAADLIAWHQALLGGKLLKPESLKLMLAPGRLSDGRLASAAHAKKDGAASADAPLDYGFGISTGIKAGRRVIGHGGAINGFNADLKTYPDLGITIVLLTNTSAGTVGVLEPVTDAALDSVPTPAAP